MVLKTNCDNDDDIPLKKKTYSNFRQDPLFFCLSLEVVTKKWFKHFKKCVLSL